MEARETGEQDVGDRERIITGSQGLWRSGVSAAVQSVCPGVTQDRRQVQTWDVFDLRVTRGMSSSGAEMGPSQESKSCWKDGIR